jgi:hypothetical protein
MSLPLSHGSSRLEAAPTMLECRSQAKNLKTLFTITSTIKEGSTMAAKKTSSGKVSRKPKVSGDDLKTKLYKAWEKKRTSSTLRPCTRSCSK